MGIDMAFFRGLDPTTGRWMQVDPKAELMYGYTPYNAMGNNPISYSDPDGDIIGQVIGGIAGGAINVFNNWDKIVKNPWSAIGYAGAGVAAGVVATLPGGLAASRAILTAGNVATDIVSGNLPNMSNFGDAAEYAGGTLLDAWSTTSSAKSLGKLAELGLKPLAKQVGKEVLGEGAFSLISDAELAEMTLQWYGETVGTGVRVEITAKAIDWGSRAATNIMFSGVNTALGVHGNSVNSPKSSGYYEIEFESGNKYHGVGDEKRMMQSAKIKEKYYQDPVKNKTFTKTSNKSEAYILEQKGIVKSGGRIRDGGRTYNKYWSPGKKLLKLLK